jgi:hypothetical protein
MLENNQFSCGYFSPCCRMVMLEHIYQAVPEQFQVIFLKFGLFSQMSGNISFCTVQAIRYNLFFAHRLAFFSIFFVGDGTSSDCYFLLKNRVNAAGKT